VSRLICILPLALAACGVESADFAYERSGPPSPVDAGETPAEPEIVDLRVDVYPTLDLTGDSVDDGFRALPKSSPRLRVDGTVDVEVGLIELDAPIRFTGRIEGFRLNPQVTALPGEILPVEATVRLALPGTVQDYVVSTDEFGDFAAWVGPQAVYNLIVQPLDAAFPAVQDSLPITDSARDLELTLPVGVPVFGRVATSAGGIEGARVWLVDASGDRSGVAETDDEGWYMVRALPGVYDVVSDGGNPLSRPTITHPDVEVDPDVGAFVNFDYVNQSPALVGGRVVSEVDVDLQGAEVRLTATNLIGYDGVDASWSFSARLQQGDLFLAQVPPGSYDVEALPPEVATDALRDPLDRATAPNVSPARRTDVIVVDDKTLVDIELTETKLVLGSVVDEFDRGVEATRVDCSEVGFGERQWSVLTDVFGRFQLQLPQVMVQCRATPTADSGLAGLSFSFVPGEGEGPLVTLASGVELRGRVVGPDGRPEEFATVSIRREQDETVLGTGLTDEEGRYAVRVVP